MLRDFRLLTILISVIWGTQAAASHSLRIGAVGDLYASEQVKNFSNGQLEARYDFTSEGAWGSAEIQLGGSALFGKEIEFNAFAPQAYWNYVWGGESLTTELTIGRKVFAFSQIDEYWKLGEVQPLYRWDALQAEIQGLAGIFFEIKNKNLELLLFASGLYLPTQGPSFKVSGGELISGNPWFAPPVDQLVFTNLVFNLRFDVITPDIPDVLFQPSFGASAKIKTENDKYWIRASYFDKFKNELSLPFLPSLNTGNLIGDVRVFAQITEHQVAAADIGFTGDDVQFVISGLWESGTSFDVNDPNWFFPLYSDQYKVGATVQWNMRANHTLQAGWLRTFNNNITIGGGTPLDSVDAFSYRNQYNNVVDVSLSSAFVAGANGWYRYLTMLRLAYDYEADNALVSAQVGYQYTPSANLFARIDVFGGEDSDNTDYNDLLSQYQENDRINMGVRYVF